MFARTLDFDVGLTCVTSILCIRFCIVLIIRVGTPKDQTQYRTRRRGRPRMVFATPACVPKRLRWCPLFYQRMKHIAVPAIQLFSLVKSACVCTSPRFCVGGAHGVFPSITTESVGPRGCRHPPTQTCKRTKRYKIQSTKWAIAQLHARLVPPVPLSTVRSVAR